jgi:transposase-like protein
VLAPRGRSLEACLQAKGTAQRQRGSCEARRLGLDPAVLEEWKRELRKRKSGREPAEASWTCHDQQDLI